MLYLIPLLSDSREIPRTKCKTSQEAEAQGQLGNFGESFEANGLWPVYNCTISKKNYKRTRSIPLSFFFFSRHKFFKFRVNSELNKVVSNWVEACSAPVVNSIKKSQVPPFFFVIVDWASEVWLAKDWNSTEYHCEYKLVPWFQRP